MDTALSKQVAVVTGASSGIGKAVAQALAHEGARLCVVGRNQGLLREAFRDSRVLQADLAVEEDILRLGKQIEREFGYVDILVHSAGLYSSNTFEKSSASDFDELFRVNVRAPYLLTQALLPMLRIHKGQIVFINSSLGLRSKVNNNQYAATKHALKAVADGLRDEVNESGIRVLSIYVGSTNTPMQERIHKSEGRVYHPELLLQPSDIASVVINSLQLAKTAEVTDISIRPMKKGL